MLCKCLHHPYRPMRSLRSILLVNLGLLTAAALVLVSLSVGLAVLFDREAAIWVAVAYGIGSLAVFAGFGAWLVRRAVLEPLAELARTAATLANGGAPSRAPRPPNPSPQLEPPQ